MARILTETSFQDRRGLGRATMPAVSDPAVDHRERAIPGRGARGGRRWIAHRSPERASAVCSRPRTAFASPVAFGVARRRARYLSRCTAHFGVRACGRRSARPCSRRRARDTRSWATSMHHGSAAPSPIGRCRRRRSRARAAVCGRSVERARPRRVRRRGVGRRRDRRLTEIHAGTVDDLADASRRGGPPMRSRFSKPGCPLSVPRPAVGVTDPRDRVPDGRPMPCACSSSIDRS